MCVKFKKYLNVQHNWKKQIVSEIYLSKRGLKLVKKTTERHINDKLFIYIFFICSQMLAVWVLPNQPEKKKCFLCLKPHALFVEDVNS